MTSGRCFSISLNTVEDEAQLLRPAAETVTCQCLHSRRVTALWLNDGRLPPDLA